MLIFFKLPLDSSLFHKDDSLIYYKLIMVGLKIKD